MSAFNHRLLQQHNYCIINPLQVEPNLWQDLPAAFLTPKELESDADVMPVLIDLNVLSGEQRFGLIDRVNQQAKTSTYPFFSALLLSDLDVINLQQRLTQRLILRGPQGKTFFRFYDPRVFKHLGWIFNPLQQQFLLKGITQWSWFCVQAQEWKTVEGNKGSRLNFLRLDPEQWQKVANIALLNQCLTQLSDVASLNIHDKKDIQKVYQWLKLAQTQKGLKTADDYCLYVEQLVRYGSRLHQHPKMQQRIKEAEAGKSYFQLCLNLDEKRLNAYLQEMHEQEQRKTS